MAANPMDNHPFTRGISRRAALAALGGPAGAPNALLPWASPPHDPLVLCFITAALAAKPKMPKVKPKAPRP